MSLMEDFKKFAMRGNVMDMAVGVIIGGAFGKIVGSAVSDVIMPPIGMALGKVDFKNVTFGYTDEVVALTRQHNDANVVSFGARFMNQEDVLRRVDIFLNTKFEGGRHENRKNLIENA